MAARDALSLRLVDGTRATGALGQEEWLLRYRLVDATAEGLLLRMLRIRGLDPALLVGLRVADTLAEAFALGAQYDDLGRGCAAGEMVLAMYGADLQGGIRLPATEFDRAVLASQAEVLLRVRTTGTGDIAGIRVSIDVV